MVIVQKHGTSIPHAGQLQNYQFGWYEGDGKEEGSLKGDLYIGVPEGEPVKVTASAEKRLNKTIDDKFTELNSKINKGSLHTNTLTNFMGMASQGEDVSDSIKVGDQWVITAEESENTEHYNSKDTYLYVVEEFAEGEYTDDEISDGYANESGSETLIKAFIFNVGNGKKLVAKRGPLIEYSFHEVKSTIDEYNKLDATSPDDFDDHGHGIIVFGNNDVENTVNVDLAPKTRRLLDGIDDLGIVGGGSTNSPFANGFMTNIESVQLTSGENNAGKTIANSAIVISYKAQRKQDDGSFSEESQDITVDLNNLVIDEGEW